MNVLRRVDEPCSTPSINGRGKVWQKEMSFKRRRWAQINYRLLGDIPHSRRKVDSFRTTLNEMVLWFR